MDSGIAVVEGKVTSSILLATNISANAATIECEVCHEASRSILDEEAFLVVVRAGGTHVDDNVLQTCSLGDLPVYSSARFVNASRHFCHIDDEVANLTEKVVLVDIPIRRRILACGIVIRVRIDHAHTSEVSRSLDGRYVESIAHKLRVVRLDDGLFD